MENVRMGELAVSNTVGDELVAIGLGSCVGVAMVDRKAGVAGLAHVVLPESHGKPGPAGKFADLAVPDLVARLSERGAARGRLEAVLIGGARMFTVGASFDIGARNADAVREALLREGIRVAADETGGTRGRTARVIVGEEISSQLAGGPRTSLLPGWPESGPNASHVPEVKR
jgi:chemotaxis protein CheD